MIMYAGWFIRVHWMRRIDIYELLYYYYSLLIKIYFRLSLTLEFPKLQVLC